MTEGRSRQPSRSRLIWIVPLVALALGATATWWFVRGPSVVSDADSEADSDPTSIVSKDKRRDPAAYVRRFVGKEDAESINQLVQIYSKWAPYPETIEARKLAVNALLAHPNVNVALEAVLTAVDGDQTRKEQDPMWRYLVQGVSKMWDSVTFPLGRDRMYIEERAKPRDLLLESLAEIPAQKLSDGQRNQLVADFIDLYPGLKADQKPTADRALAQLGSSDLVEILAGRGLGENSHLKVVADRNRAIETARAIRLPPSPPPEDDSLPPTPSQGKPAN